MELNPKTVLLIPLSRVRGGKTTKRTKLDEGPTGANGEGVFKETKVKVTIENVDERATAEKLVAQAAHVIRRASVCTLIGYLTPQERIAEIDADLAEVRARANVFNANAETCQITIGCMPVEISVALGPEAARALADHVREELTRLRDQLRAGDAPGARATLLRSKNLHTLSVGVQADSIRFAIQEGNDRLADLKDALKDKGGISESPESAGKALDLSMIEAGIGMFTYEGQQDSAPKLALVGGI